MTEKIGFTEKRAYKQFQAKEEAFAAVKDVFGKLGPIKPFFQNR